MADSRNDGNWYILLVKVISKIVRLMIGIALIATIFYFVSSMNIAMMIMIL
ncbi:hypothetical protein KHA80_00790 [Anaerobacillus sp. HL2]|nr:hypothetical protein KHA80_00790 [Anaerobacillus sp. HL2]